MMKSAGSARRIAPERPPRSRIVNPDKAIAAALILLARGFSRPNARDRSENMAKTDNNCG
jgi:hypothetical protein